MRKILFLFNVLKNNCVNCCFLWIICSILIGGNQEIDSYIDSVLTGHPNAGSQMLSRLLDSYPNHPGVMYLQGLHELNGEKAVKVYKLLYKNHPNSEYADDSVMRIGEYYYVSGLYIQAAEWFKKMPIYYPWSEQIERGVNLYLNSLIVVGSVDTAKFYSQVFQKRFPKMKVEERILTTFLESEKSILKSKLKKDKKSLKSSKTKNILGKYSLQVGAFSSIINANTTVKILKSGGYSPRVEEVNKKGLKLYSVRLGYYGSSESAKREGDKLRMKLGYDNIIINNY